ncbi:MAG: LuxR C-terminal-related transcriptional regulator [Woeseiaceae bacterium]|nr:LuxR C-terminal-related transcriptional regulator [Woeseiaceae bacterium]
MAKPALIYGLALAAGVFLLHWLEVQYAIRQFTTEIYIVILALAFAGVGIWFGRQTGERAAADKFERNETVIRTLGLTPKEVQVLSLLAEGGSNAEIAKALFVSTSTVKTHLIHIYQKLEVSRRTEAVNKGRALKIIP